MNDRIIKLIGLNNFKKIEEAKILLVGIGGVGGTAFESLIRSGFKNIAIIDYDNIDESNLNRQIITNINNIGNKKIEVAKKRALEINQNLNIQIFDWFLDKNNLENLGEYDYIIDACDSVQTKIELIKYCLNNNIKIISSMGMGNRLDPSKVVITKLSKTLNDPLAKKIRTILRKDGFSLNIPVVSSLELPLTKEGLYSMMMVPSSAGLLITYYIINDIIKE